MALFRDSPQYGKHQSRDVPCGIGGWLILPAIGLIVSPLFLGDSIGKSLMLLFGTEASEIAFAQPGFKAVLVSEVVAESVLLVLGLFVLVEFFRRKRYVPVLMITLFVLNFAIMLLMLALMARVLQEYSPRAIQHILYAFVSCMIWIPYFLTSERVRATFVEP